MIKVDKLSFSYGSVPCLENISLTLEEGKIYGLLGENGVGKTTLLTLLCGLKKVRSGRIDTDGENPWDRSPLFLENQYYLPDEVAPVNSSAAAFAKENGVFWPRFSMDVFNAVMTVFEVDPGQKMTSMSAGQLKKTYIAFALACTPKYLFMDEPTNGLDIPSKAQFRKAILSYTADDSVIVISTHQVKDLENVIDPIIILDRCDVLLNAGIAQITEKLYFDYGTEVNPASIYTEALPGGLIQVYQNTSGKESKVNIEALFNAVHNNKEMIKGIFSYE